MAVCYVFGCKNSTYKCSDWIPLFTLPFVSAKKKVADGQEQILPQINVVHLKKRKCPHCDYTMGAYTYMTELHRKKQSDVLRFMLRVRCLQYRQLTRLQEKLLLGRTKLDVQVFQSDHVRPAHKATSC